MAGGVMPKMVIEVPEEFTEVGKAMVEHLTALQRTVSRLGGGKSVDYAEIEQAMAESAGRTALAGHRAILQSLDTDVPAVRIGGVRYTRVGRCEAPYHTMVGSASVERSLYRQSGERGGQPGGTVTLHDKEGVGRHTIRYGCMPDGDIIGLRDRLVADAATLRSKRPDLKIELLCDGAPEMWNLLEDGFIPKFGNDLYHLVDLHHFMEKLGAAARVIDDGTAAGERLRRWKMSLLNRARAATGILEELTASGMDEGAGDDHPVHAAIIYIQSHSADADRMNYARARRLGLALGSGNVEATCKSLFETRMKRCGSRWKEETGQHIVQLRCLALSDR